MREVTGNQEHGRRRRRARAAAAIAVTAGLLAPPALAAPASAGTIVLGNAAYAPNGSGFGTAKPRVIFNGGAPSGRVERIRWTGWGHRIATGRGYTPIYRPEGGYYRRLGRIQLRASGRGTCPGTSQRAYLKLRARVVSKPGGRLGKWFSWSGSRTICTFD
ncbi:hypothetical protein PAI11_26080 [Patulibacter medicamentivorans]|uniref:Uncharacterized protein n=1 Tax=Patulibacter medicamentivorans TaxID=1097667 RepID=H0E706_9ACTN|nr:hypothetical protein [Patulibacter medicamentivorans]EHN10501.1 hypothetical protein PAI11_26080 [Patulibacter medicamentivorans]